MSNEQKPRVIDAGVGAKAGPAKISTKPGPIVEDTSVVGGVDAKTGAPVVRPKTPDGRADESTKPTDPREKQ